jgi:hypothetical protein
VRRLGTTHMKLKREKAKYSLMDSIRKTDILEAEVDTIEKINAF